MTSQILRSFTLLSLCLLTGCAEFTYDGQPWRLRGARSIGLTKGGVRKQNLGRVSYIDNTFYPSIFRINTTAGAFHEKITKGGSVTVGATVDPHSITGGLDRSHTVEGYFKSYTVTDELALVKVLNSPENSEFRQHLKGWGSGARVITAIVKVFDHKEAYSLKGTLAASGSVPVSAINETAKLKIDAKYASEKTLRLDNDTVYAYQYSKPIWDKNQPDKIAHLETDLGFFFSR